MEIHITHYQLPDGSLIDMEGKPFSLEQMAIGEDIFIKPIDPDVDVEEMISRLVENANAEGKTRIFEHSDATIRYNEATNNSGEDK